MERNERIEYARMFLANEFERIGKVVFLSDDEWQSKCLDDPNVDPTGAHKKYGLSAPQYVNGHWAVLACTPLLVAYAYDEDDDTFQRWLEYWVIHLGMHLVITDWAQNLGDTPTLDEIEARVEELYEEEAPDISAMAAEMRRKNITLRTPYGT